MQHWKDIVGYENLYSISNLGEIRSKDRLVKHRAGSQKLLKGKNRKQVVSTHGYMTIILSKEGINTRYMVHRLVLSTFQRGPIGKEDACHCDGDKKNNALSNLRWDTRLGNMSDTEIHGTRRKGEAINFSKLTEGKVLEIISDNRKQHVIANEYGICQSAVSRIKNKSRWKHLFV